MLSGLVAEVTPTWFVLLLGSALNFTGYFMIWLAVTGRIAKPQVWQMCLYICIGANSQNFANTGALVTCIQNFPESRGAMMGLLKGFTGLSGAILTQIYLAVYGDDATALILLIGWLPAALSVVFVFTIRRLRAERQPNEKRVFYHFLYVSIGLALFIMLMNIVQKKVEFNHTAYAMSATVVCVFLFLPLLIVIREELHLWNAMKNPQFPTKSHNQNLNQNQLMNPKSSPKNQKKSRKSQTHHQRPVSPTFVTNQPEETITQFSKHFSAWICWFSSSQHSVD